MRQGYLRDDAGLSATGVVSWSRRVRAGGEVLCCELRERLPKLTPLSRPPRISEMTDSDDQLCLLLDRGYELAAGHLEGINEAALELADAAGDDPRVMERAFRVVAERVRLDPSHANNQVASLIRRAIEL